MVHRAGTLPEALMATRPVLLETRQQSSDIGVIGNRADNKE